MKHDHYIYPAILEKDEDDFISLTFPDFSTDMPAIHSVSKNQGLKLAREHLAIHISYLLEEEKVIPAPSMNENIKINSDQKLVHIDVSLEDYKELIQIHKDFRHFHPGYYENDEDIEGIAIKNKNGYWDVYFDDFVDEGLFNSIVERDENYGVLLFTTDTDEEVEILFRNWVEAVLLPYRKTK